MSEFLPKVPEPELTFASILGAIGKRLGKLREAGVFEKRNSKHRAGSKVKSGGSKVDRKATHKRKVAAASRKRNRGADVRRDKQNGKAIRVANARRKH